MAGRHSGTFTVLNVAEKNDAAKEISRVLSSGRSQRVGYLKVVFLQCNVYVICSINATAEYGLFRQVLECVRAKSQVCKCALDLRCAHVVPA